MVCWRVVVIDIIVGVLGLWVVGVGGSGGGLRL